MHFSRCPRVCELTSTLVRLVLLACSYASQFAIFNESAYCDSQSLSPEYQLGHLIEAPHTFERQVNREAIIKAIYSTLSRPSACRLSLTLVRRL